VCVYARQGERGGWWVMGFPGVVDPGESSSPAQRRRCARNPRTQGFIDKDFTAVCDPLSAHGGAARRGTARRRVCARPRAGSPRVWPAGPVVPRAAGRAAPTNGVRRGAAGPRDRGQRARRGWLPSTSNVLGWTRSSARLNSGNGAPRVCSGALHASAKRGGRVSRGAARLGRMGRSRVGPWRVVGGATERETGAVGRAAPGLQQDARRPPTWAGRSGRPLGARALLPAATSRSSRPSRCRCWRSQTAGPRPAGTGRRSRAPWTCCRCRRKS
jgi:hypothetical protein